MLQKILAQVMICFYNDEMRTPARKPGKYTHLKPDPHLTETKFSELKNKLERLKEMSRPRAAEEVRRLAEMGDFSDNAAYSIAKGRLRGINQKILELEDHLKHAVIISAGQAGDRVKLGSEVTVEINGRQKIYRILGSSETDPSAGIISHRSPLGASLLGRRAGDRTTFTRTDKTVACRIIKIE